MNKKGIGLIGLGVILIIPSLFGSEGGYFLDSLFGISIGVLIILVGLYQLFINK